jgi:hypothetical protein
MAACSDCGQKKGHMNGCPQADKDKRGASPGGKQTPKPANEEAKKRCLETWGNDHLAEHPGAFHICMQMKFHGGKHQCQLCGNRP